MTFKEYQQKVSSTAIYPEEYQVTYPALGLSNEVGELQGHLKKAMRDGEGDFWDEGRLELMKKELGDVLWYVAALAIDLGLSLEDIAQTNLDKLKGRKERGTLQGSGEDR